MEQFYTFIAHLLFLSNIKFKQSNRKYIELMHQYFYRKLNQIAKFKAFHVVQFFNSLPLTSQFNCKPTSQ